MDFITVSGIRLSSLPDEIQALAGLYAPLDGLNERGLAVSVNMIQDNATIEQNTDKPDVTTTTAVRLLLDQAADVEKATELLNRYDLHNGRFTAGNFHRIAVRPAGRCSRSITAYLRLENGKGD